MSLCLFNAGTFFLRLKITMIKTKLTMPAMLACLACAAALSGCSSIDSAINDFRQFQDDHLGWLEEITNEDLAAVKPQFTEAFREVEFDKVNAVLDGQLKPSDYREPLKLGNGYYLMTSDCNLRFEVRRDRPVINDINEIPGEYLCNGGKLSGKTLMAQMQYEAATRPPVGSCALELEAIRKFQEKGGRDLTLEEIQAYKAEEAAERAALNPEGSVLKDGGKTIQIDAATASQAMITGEMVKQSMNQIRQQNTKNGMMYVRLKSDPAKKGGISGVTKDGKVRILLEDTGETIEVSHEDIELANQ